MNERKRERRAVIRTNELDLFSSRRATSRVWTIRSYLVLLCLIVLSQSMISSGYIGSIVSSLERYYGFSTARLGVAFSSYDIMGVLSIPLISYFGSQNNRPYAINGYEKDAANGNSSNFTGEHLCQSNATDRSVDSHDPCSSLSNSILLHLTPNLIDKRMSNALTRPQPTWTYYVLILSMIIMSVGASPFYTLGITFLTDHLNKDDQAICTSE
jgi:MFS family permease